jgi:predicted ribosome quality control (RQC) complex YloA/Tae2 family protein
VSLNCAEIDAVLKEFPETAVARAFYQKDRHSLEILISTPSGSRIIWIDTTDRMNRICLAPEKTEPSGQKQRFAQYLHSLAAGFKITRISQPGQSRIVVMQFESEQNQFRLICRLWGTASNLIVTDCDDIILDTLKRYPKRSEWPGDRWEFPEKKGDVRTFTVREEFLSGNISTAVWNFYRDLEENETFQRRFVHLKETVEEQLAVNRQKMETFQSQLNEDNLNRLLNQAQLLNSQLYRFIPGEKSVTIEDWNQGGMIELPVSPELTPSQNAQKYFDRYRKLRDSQDNLTRQREETEKHIRDLEEILRILPSLTDSSELIELESRLKSGKLSRYLRKNQESARSRFGRMVELSDQYIAYISRNSKEADEILKRIAKGNDYWFHIRDYAGSHVVVKEIRNREITPRAKTEAALLALYFSKGRNSDEGDIYFTRVKYLHKPNTGEPGLVFPTREKNIKVRMDKELIAKLLESQG